MSLFDNFLSIKKDQPTVQNNPVGSVPNEELHRKISLRKEMVLDEVKRKNITATIARVVFVLDHSGSMIPMYKDGTVQNVLERIFPVAMCFDDNSELEFYWFDSEYKELPSVTTANLNGYVQNVILSKKEHFGGTCYAPVMEQIVKRYGIKQKANIPTFVIFITDGGNSDRANAKRAIIEASHYNIFWKFIGIGSTKFDFLESLDTLKGRFIDNANFISVNNLNEIDDKQLYALILEEYDEWLNRCRINNIPVQ